MNKTPILPVILGLAAVFALCAGLGPDSRAQFQMSRAEIENFLRNAQIVSVKKEEIAGRTAAWDITLRKGDVVQRAVFKHVNFSRPTLLPDSYTYELAAYEMDKLLDWNRVPPAVKRTIEGITGSLQIRIEDCIPLDEQRRRNIPPPDPDALEKSLEEIAVFENLVYCERKELDDILIHMDDWKVCRVDFSEAFSPTPDLIPEHLISRCSRKLYNNLKSLEEETIRARLSRWLNPEEIQALVARKILIIKTLEKLIEKKGEKAVLF
ncbi:MAG: hypothetical protein ACE5LV_06065 [Candidatus Aminicenantales bacterium]